MQITNELLLRYATYGMMLIICILFYRFIIKLTKRAKDVSGYTEKMIDERIKENGGLAGYRKKMSKLGVMYHLGDYNLDPAQYILGRWGAGVLLGMISYLFFEKFMIAFLLIPVGYFLVGFIFSKINQEDNKALIMDLYNTYANLKTQLKSGLYLTSSLEYSYAAAVNERYKEALGELIVNFSDKTMAAVDAIEIFRNRFDSKEIDKFCSLLCNTLRYGADDSYAGDIMNEISSLVLANTMEIEHNVEEKSGLVIFTFFGIIIFIVILSIISGFQGIELV